MYRRHRLLIALPLALAAMCRLPTDAAEAGQPASGGEHEVSIVNHAPHPINELYISPVSSGDWGADRLGDAMLASGAVQHVRLQRGSDCKVDVQVIYRDASREERHSVDICRDRQLVFDGSKALLPAVSETTAHPVVIVNEAARPIQQVLISPADSGDWGDDLLGQASISVGDRVTLSYRGSCLTDLRIVYDIRSAEERRNVDVCTLHGVTIRAGWTTADRLEPVAAPQSSRQPAQVSLHVVNHAAQAARQLFVFPEGSVDRGQDLLVSGLLDSGGQVSVPMTRPAGTCRFDAHVVYGDKGSNQDLHGIDLCHATTLVLSSAS